MKDLNLIELLKGCPKDMELDCAMFDDVYFDYIDDVSDIINCYIQNSNNKTGISFNKYGHYSSLNKSKCVIFPKGKTTWEGFHRPFKDGDILTNERGSIFIYKGPMYYNKLLSDFYCGYRVSDGAFVPKLFKDKHFGDISECRFATEKEKQKLLTVIRDNGYNWDPATKILDKLTKFKVGDRIQHKSSKLECTLGEYAKGISAYRTNIGLSLTSKDLEQWELAPNKFDITTLKPFESKVLVRTNNGKWIAAFYSHYDNDSSLHYCVVGGLWYAQCIPYKGNEYLLNTTDDCSEYYKTWK